MLEPEITPEAFCQTPPATQRPLLLDVREPWEFQPPASPTSSSCPWAKSPAAPTPNSIPTPPSSSSATTEHAPSPSPCGFVTRASITPNPSPAASTPGPAPSTPPSPATEPHQAQREPSRAPPAPYQSHKPNFTNNFAFCNNFASTSNLLG